MTTAKLPRADIEYALDNSLGWCTGCADFTRECTEPDAEGYDCPVCESDSVVGAELAYAVLGIIQNGDNE